MQETKATIEMLNDLVQINNDRIKGYERALNEMAGDANIIYMFKNCISESHLFKMELANEVKALSKKKSVENTTAFSGTLHRDWVDLKTAFAGYITRNAIADCEMVEDAILNTYNQALQQKYLPVYIRQILNRQKFILQDAHHEIKTLSRCAS